MVDEVQRVIESLAAGIDRSVAIDDLDFRLVAFTSHRGRIDPIRQEAILQRQGPSRATAWVRRLGVARARGPMRIPPNDELGMLARVCIPLRAHDQHLGYLWLIDPAESLPAHQLDAAVAAAQECAELVYRERIRDELADARERELLRDLLADDVGVREMSAAELVTADLLDLRGALTVLTVGPAVTGLDQATVRAAVRETVERNLHGVPRRGCLRLVRPDHAVIVVTAVTAQLRPGLASSLAGPTSAPVELAVGVGDPADDPATLFPTYAHALAALRLAQALPSFRPVARWSQLGVYALLSELAGERLRSTPLHPAVTTLLGCDPALVDTLERFLDRGGDTRAVAGDLRLHRASVYYRLERIRELTGVDLADGEQRLGLHLSLKIHRMRGGAA